jgi:hypothetical protein
MVFESPLCLGYREHRAIHFAHHRFASTDRDPELYQIVGGPWRALANAMISPERGFAGWVRRHGISRSLAIEGTVRCAAFITLADNRTGRVPCVLDCTSLECGPRKLRLPLRVA